MEESTFTIQKTQTGKCNIFLILSTFRKTSATFTFLLHLHNDSLQHQKY